MILEFVVVTLTVFDVIAFVLLFSWKSQRKAVLFFFIAINFLLTPISVASRDWIGVSIYGLTTIVMSVYLAVEEIKKK